MPHISYCEGISEFYILAGGNWIIMGGIQSISRSTYAKLMPETKDTASFLVLMMLQKKIGIVIGTFTFWIYE